MFVFYISAPSVVLHYSSCNFQPCCLTDFFFFLQNKLFLLAEFIGIIIKETLSILNDTCRKSCFFISWSFLFRGKRKCHMLFHILPSQACYIQDEKINNFVKTLQHLSKNQSNFTVLQGVHYLGIHYLIKTVANPGATKRCS